jgi:RimJ/RimL family protein N-acetyltransferase
MAAFTAEDPTDRDAFDAHWQRIRGDDAVVIKTILFDGDVAGSIAKFDRDGDPEVTYWIGKEFWGKGIATKALSAFLDDIPARPLFGRVAKDNVASIRVLEKCGFTVSGHDRGFANARGAEIDEFIMKLP